MLERIAVFGAESTGKSALAQALAEHFDEPWAPEYVREFWNAHDGQITHDDLKTIGRGQIASEQAAAARARRLVICDTELLTNTLWADLIFPHRCPEWIRAAAEQRCCRYRLYLLCDIDLPFVPDPQRSFPRPTDRVRCARLWRETLLTRNLPFVDIRGSGQERTRRALRAVETVLTKSSG